MMNSLTVSPSRLSYVLGQQSPIEGECVVYLMMRSQRALDNLAYDAAVDIAEERGQPLVVVLSLGAGPEHNNARHMSFMLGGFEELIGGVIARSGTVVVRGMDGPPISQVLSELRPSIVVTDDDVMPKARRMRARLASSLDCPMLIVDADVVVPQSTFTRQEYAARTIRPKIHLQLADRLGEHAHDRAFHQALPVDRLAKLDEVWVLTTTSDPKEPQRVVELLATSVSAWPWMIDVAPVDAPSGARAAAARLEEFLATQLGQYADRRNHPEVDGTSRLSAHLHYGQISPITAARAASRELGDGASSFVEELVVRRELAINFVRHNPSPDTFACAPDWARESLMQHREDLRPALYGWESLLACDTIDPLWNAAQNQLMTTGFMPGYLRMYWAKKILEWTPDPDTAFAWSLALNDIYSLDGRDANGITGVAWAVAGVHDRAWPSRPVFGKVRCMTLASTGRKFDSKRYIQQWAPS